MICIIPLLIALSNSGSLALAINKEIEQILPFYFIGLSLVIYLLGMIELILIGFVLSFALAGVCQSIYA